MKEVLKKIYMLPAWIANKVSFAFHDAEVGKGCIVNGRLRLYGKGHLRMGDNVRINSMYRMNPIGGNTFASIYIKDGAIVEIGKKAGISNCALYAAEYIKIGDRVKLGGSVKIYDTDFHSTDFHERAIDKNSGIATAPVVIGNDVFIGANSTILKGVTIGDRSVIGAGSVVTKSIPEDEVWAGVPAKFIKNLTNRSEGDQC